MLTLLAPAYLLGCATPLLAVLAVYHYDRWHLSRLGAREPAPDLLGSTTTVRAVAEQRSAVEP